MESVLLRPFYGQTLSLPVITESVSWNSDRWQKYSAAKLNKENERVNIYTFFLFTVRMKVGFIPEYIADIKRIQCLETR